MMASHFCPSHPCPYCYPGWRVSFGRTVIEQWNGAWSWPAPASDEDSDDDYGLTTG